MLTLSILTPEKKVLETKSLSVTVPTAMGEITVLPSHAPLFSLLSSGEIKIKLADGGHLDLVVNQGFVSVFKDFVKILTDFSIKSDEINELAAKEAVEKAKKAMEEKISEENFAQAEAELLRSLLQLKTVNKRKRG